MSAAKIANLERLVGTPRDGALLRYGLGMEYEKAGDAGRKDEAGAAWTRGLEAAKKRGDKQAEKMMAVFMKRLHRTD